MSKLCVDSMMPGDLLIAEDSEDGTELISYPFLIRENKLVDKSNPERCGWELSHPWFAARAVRIIRGFESK